jgi:hypothetical protein
VQQLYSFNRRVMAPASVLVAVAEEHFRLSATTAVEVERSEGKTTFNWISSSPSDPGVTTSGGAITIESTGYDRCEVTVNGWGDSSYAEGLLRLLPAKAASNMIIGAEKRYLRRLLRDAERTWSREIGDR